MRLTILLLLFNINLFGQFRLDVAGDARITGKLDLLSGISNTFIGRRAGESNTEGSGNSFFGLQAGLSNTTGYVNSFFGANAGLANTTGFYNSFFGTNAGLANSTGDGNNFFGAGAGQANTSGDSNCFFGNYTGWNNTVGKWNCFFGNSTGISNTTGSGNCFFGLSVGGSNTIGSNNSFFGLNAGFVNSTGTENSFFGRAAGFSNTTGSYNCFFGSETLNTTGSNNSFFGKTAGLFNTTGSDNCFFGDQAGSQNSIGLVRSGFGYSSNSLGLDYSNSTGLGHDADPTAVNNVRLGNSSITSISGQVPFSATSDARFKTQINRENVPGIAFIKKLSPVTYYFDIKKFEDWKYAQYGERDTLNWEGKYVIEKMQQTGFIAQEVEEAATSMGYDFSGVDKPVSEKSYYGLRYSTFVVPLVRAVQEQQIQIDSQEEEIKEAKRLILDQQYLLAAEVNKNKLLDIRLADLERMIGQVLEGNESARTGKEEKVIPTAKPTLEQNIPNPFEGTTRIDYFIPETSRKNSFLLISGVDGKEIRRIKLQNTGSNSISIEMNQLSRGTYFYSLIVDGKIVETKKMIYVN